jgi:hypothetical protein
MRRGKTRERNRRSAPSALRRWSTLRGEDVRTFAAAARSKADWGTDMMLDDDPASGASVEVCVWPFSLNSKGDARTAALEMRGGRTLDRSVE